MIELFAYVRSLLESLAAGTVDLEPRLPDAWIKAHLEYVVQFSRQESDEAAKRRAKRREVRRKRASQLGERNNSARARIGG